jgi:hypothetical protein
MPDFLADFSQVFAFRHYEQALTEAAIIDVSGI